MVKVLYDHSSFTNQRFGGISYSFIKLIENLPLNIDYIIGVIATKNYHLLSSNIIDLSDSPELIEFDNFLTFLPSKLRNKIFLSIENRFSSFNTIRNQNINYCKKIIKENEFDILHTTSFDTYFLDEIRKPFILTVHDLVHEVYKNKKSEQVIGRNKLIPKSAHIVVVSENTKRDLIKFYNVPEKKISVIYHGYEAINVLNSTAIIDQPYILYVGARTSLYKNFAFFLDQCALFIHKHRDFRIVCTGQSFSKEEQALIEYNKLTNHVIQKFCSIQELNTLYQYAFAFVYPSSYEGFGLPILDAFNAGCPVIVNNKSCFPEIAQDCALYFDSDNMNSLFNCLEQLYQMTENERKVYINKGKSRLSCFSWKNSSKQLAKVYTNIY